MTNGFHFWKLDGVLVLSNNPVGHTRSENWSSLLVGEDFAVGGILDIDYQLGENRKQQEALLDIHHLP